MKTLQEIKDEVAKSYTYTNWAYFSAAKSGHHADYEIAINKVAKLYAEAAISQCAQESVRVISARRIGASANMEAILKVKTLLK